MEQAQEQMPSKQDQETTEWERHMRAAAAEIETPKSSAENKNEDNSRFDAIAERLAKSDKFEEYFGEAFKAAANRWFAELPESEQNGILGYLEAETIRTDSK